MLLSTSALFTYLYWTLLGKRGQVEEDLKQYFSDWTSPLIICAIQVMFIAFIAGSYAVLAPSPLASTIGYIGAAFTLFTSKASIDHFRKYRIKY
jgi:hypothetical protein